MAILLLILIMLLFGWKPTSTKTIQPSITS